MGMNKKGFFFTFLAIALTLVLVLSFNISEYTPLKKKSEVVSLRVTTINNLIIDVEDDLKKGIAITTKRTLLGLQEYITEQGEFVENFNGTFKEGFLNGTIYGTTIDLLNQSTFTNWTQRISVQSEKVDVGINFTINNLSIRHVSPWRINVSVGLMMNVTDLRGTAHWGREHTVSSKIDIIDFEDPLFLVNTLGKVTNIITPTNVTDFVSGFDTAGLMVHANNSWYVHTNLSPTYLKRMQGDLTPSELGIESLVYVPKLEAQEITAMDRSVVDFVYFGNQSTVHHRINNTPDWLRIDDEHLKTYEVEDHII